MADYRKKRKDEIEGIYKTFDQNLLQIERCLENDLKEASIIFIVSAFESFLKDVFILCKSEWFGYNIMGLSVTEKIGDKRRRIYNYLKEINVLDEFIKIRYIYSYDGFDSSKSNLFSPSDITPIYEVLFKKEEDKDNIKSKKINFQNLKDANGVKVAYKTFFDIDLLESLAEDSSTLHRKWEKLDKLFDERHDIVHKGKETEFSKEDIRTVLDSIKYLKKSLDERLIQRMPLV